MNANEIMVEVRNVTKRYADIRALDDVSFQVGRGEVLGFLGPNGAGKTTLMKILTCFIAPTSGTARVAGTEIFGNTIEIRRQVGYLPENTPLYLDMRVREFLDFVADVRDIDRSKKAGALDRVVDSCGLSRVFDQEIRTLSKGFRQRVGLAQAMIHDPAILVLDEPASGLDPNQMVEIRELIKSLGRERTVILSTHNLSEVQATAKRVVIIHQGKLVADGGIEELEAERGGVRYDVLLGNAGDKPGKVEELFAAIEGVREVKLPGGGDPNELHVVVRSEGARDVRPQIFRSAVEQNWVLLGLTRQKVDLEAIFRRLTKTEAPTSPGKSA